jgi:hypothetical protein
MLQFKQGRQACRGFRSEDHAGALCPIKHPRRYLETDPVLLPRQEAPTKVPA